MRKSRDTRANDNPEVAAHDSKAAAVREILAEMVISTAPVLARNPRRTMATVFLMVAKLHNKRVLKDDSLIRAKFAAKLVEQTGSLNVAIEQLLLALETNDRRFFIDFGKCLSGEIKDSTLFDKRDRDIAEIVLFNPEMSAIEAIDELDRRGHRGISEDNFRMWKMRLLKAKPKFDKIIAQWHNKISRVTVTDNVD